MDGGTAMSVRGVHELVVAQIARTPEAVAVELGGEVLTYAALGARAARLAGYLRALGVGRDDRIGVCLERSFEQVIAVLAILELGAAYVPLDPAYPAARLAFMIADSRQRVLVTQERLAAALPAHAARAVCVDRDRAAIAQAPPLDAPPPADPDQLAYVIYTSGSTGVPKGVAMPHRVLLNLLAHQLRASPPGLRTLQFSALGFDVSFQELFATWASGGALVLTDEDTRRDPRALLELLAHARIERLFLPFVALQQLAETARAPAAGTLSLREVITAGEQLVSSEAVRAWFRPGAGADAPVLINQYGPSETHVVTEHVLDRDPGRWPDLPPIGTPVAGVTAYLLDERGALAAAGTPGELYVGELAPARGYLDRPATTAERFVPDPFARRPGARLYRTGDLARWRPDGALEFLGRIDQQVKIRGFRIELGEIESALLACPEVAACAVTARKDAGTAPRLVAYVVAATAAGVDHAALRAIVRAKLPEHMVPAAFVTLARLPLTPSGKVDKQALPAPPDDAYERAAYVAPRSPDEAALAALWADVLGVARVSIADDFFALGGHSLLATRLVARIRDRVGVELPLRAVFEAPTVERLARELARLRDSARAAAVPLTRVPRDGALPLSFAQQRLWFLDQLDPDGRAYNLASAYRLRGALDAEALRRAFAALTHRHEALRTVFPATDGVPRQHVLPPGPFALPVDDLGAVAPAEREREAARRAEQAALARFDLAAGPLVRARLLRLSATEHVLLLAMHHIISDGWSLEVLWEEVAALYDGFARGAPVNLPPLAIQYADYAAWLRRWLTGATLERQLAYWTEQLADAPAELALPYKGPRPAHPTFRGGRVDVRLDARLGAALHDLARRHGATVFMVLLGALRALIARYAGARDVCIGTAIANRSHREVEGLIGFFVNTVVLRGRVDDADRFVDLLARERELALGAHAHQHAPFELVIDALGVERHPNRTPLIQVMCVDQGEVVTQGALPGLATAPFRIDLELASFDLIVDTREHAGAREVSLIYSADLFEREVVEQLAAHYVRLLEESVRDPDARVAEAALLSAEERARVVHAWNATARPYPRDRCVHELVAAQAARTPEAPAVRFGDARLTYRELDERANALAHRLRALGVGPDVLVATFLERSPEMIVVLLAILKAGGAYLPLEASSPRERLTAMLADAAPAVAIHVGAAPDVALPAGTQVLAYADDAAAEAPPATGVGAAHLAYVEFTSGSTGRPKGVCVPHRAVGRLVHANRFLTIGAGDVFLQLAPVSFDASTLEIWGALANGACVAVAPPGLLGLDEIAAAIRAHAVTHLWLTKGLFDQMIECHADTVAGVRHVLAGGDVLTPERVRTLLARLPAGAVFSNGYGPTENTTFTTTLELDRASTIRGAIPIGRPISNTTTYVVDAQLRPVPVGVPGQLVTGGDGLARGYLASPALTAERFVPDPFGPPGARLYCTGDRARWRPDGTLEFLGRIDQQVKIRGFRIEPGEIELVLQQCPGVHGAVVVARDDAAGGGKQLVAYVGGAGVDVADVRGFIAARLPDYMVPSAFVVLDALPLTPNGKVDRKALPAPAHGAFVHAAYVAPRTERERVLAEIWGDVLGLERVSTGDDFFALGGHSLLATGVISRIRDRLGAELPVRSMFEARTIERLARRIGAADDPAAGLPLVPVARTGELPLSFAQQRLWFIDQLEPASALYNVPDPLELRGPLDVEALARSIAHVIARHEALRTTFVARAGEPVQVIAPALDIELARVDLTAVPEPARRAEAMRRTIDDARRPFDLARGPLVRTTLLRLAPDEHWLLVTSHHIITDGWSTGVFRRELAASYAALREGRAPALPPLPVQYGDFAVWQRQWLTGAVLEGQLRYWRQQLAGAPNLLELPTDRPRPPVMSYAGASRSFRLPAALAASLHAVGSEASATLFMTLLAAFQTLLHRYSGQADILVGTPVANRTRNETEGLIGFFVNTLVMRGDLAGDPTFRELLARVREAALGAYAHQDIPFERLVAELQPARSLSYAPLFQVMFVLQNTPGGGELAGVEQRAVALEGGLAKFDITLAIDERPDGLHGAVEYKTELFDDATIARMIGHFERLLEAIVEAPDRRISELPLLGAPERRQLARWSGTHATYGQGELAHRRFEAQAARTPDAIALVLDDARLTYGELDVRANRLAHHLQQLGAGPEVVIAVAMDRSLEMVVAILAVLKAGAAYLPLDPRYPAERLAFMLDDAGARVVLADQRCAEVLPPGPTVIRIDRIASELAACPAHAPASAVAPEHLMYVIYTSGSTGRPKGVLITHANVARLMRATEAWYGFGPADVWTLFHSHAFDVSVWEIWGALCYGGRLVIVPWHVSRAPDEYYALLAREQVTVLCQTPSAFRQLIPVEDDPARVRDLALRYVIFAGEALELASLRPWVARHGAARPLLVNMYGITETTVHSTYRALALEDVLGSPGSVIGVPIPDLQVHLLDAHLEPVPIGVTGEIYVGGAGVCRGYLGRPSLTAERLVPDPSSRTGARLYKSGDLARRLANGDLQYIGRNDHQVKIRGFRIELGEIEAVLAREPGIREVVALVREDVPGDKRLVAYLVGERAQLGASELRARLKGKLPEHMVPAAFVVLDELPLTTNGKVNRGALPAPDAPSGAAYVAPRTTTELAVAQAFAGVLRMPVVGADDDFFALGGHSLLATRLVAQCRARFGVALPLRTVFEAPTVAGLAAALDAAADGAGGAHAPPLRPVPRDGALPLSFAQQRLWFLQQLDPASCAHNMAFAHRLRGALDVGALEGAFAALLARHEALRTVFPASDGVPRQQVLPAGAFALPVEELGALTPADRDREARRRADAEALTPFDLARGPLVRARVLRLAADDHVLLLTLHHVVSDGWSMGIIWRELGALYGARVRGGAASLPALDVQYADYAAWLRGWLTGDVLAGQLAYWRQQLADAPRELALPYKGPRPPAPRDRGGHVDVTLDVALTSALRELAQRHGATVFMVLLAGLRTLLARYAGQQDLCIGTVVANRDRRELEGLVGFFVNTVVLRGAVRSTDRFVDVLARERDGALGAYAHQDAPLELVIEALGIERSSHRTPLIQVACVDEGEAVDDHALLGLDSAPLRTELELTGFELSIDTRERAGARELTVTYDLDLFERDTIVAFVARYQRLLAAIAAEPARPLAEVELLDAGERAALIDAPARAVAWTPRGPTVIGEIERCMRAHPDAPAILGDGAATSYRELDACSARLAARLRHAGVGPDRTVVVLAERGVAQIVGVLAALRAGGAYVPINPGLPAERMAWMLEETAPAAILVDGEPPPALATRAAAVIRLDAPATWGEHPIAPAPAVPPDALAYVIYTSGSTGRPKGVLVSRRNFDAQMAWCQRELPLTADDRCLQLHAFTFDASVQEIFWPLMVGGALVLPRAGGELEPRYLGTLVAATRTTVVQFVPSMMWMLLDSLEAPQWASVRLLITGGEALSRELAGACARAFPGAELVNAYGPTETTINATYWRCVDDGAAIPIGRPVGDTTAYVLDDALAPVPPGGIGELWIGGVQLARGYLQRPALTAERFRPNPFAARPGERIYQTGDLVRQRRDGVLEYVGRADFQVKVRGYRIELGEIEAVLHAHPAVRTAVVVARDDRAGKQLVAYACLAGDADAGAPEALRQHLAERLPGYMVPSAIVILDELPLTPSGKLDLRALPAPADDAAARAAVVLPRTATEHAIAAAWCEVLGLAEVGVEDNFFAHGGHSLLVVRLVAAIRRRLDVELPPRAVFEQPTIAAQARRVDDVRAAAAAAGAADDAGAERELLAYVRALPEDALAAQLAAWSNVALEVATLRSAGELTGPRRALLERLVAQHRIDARPSEPLARTTGATAPATFAQQLQWDYHQRGNFPTLGIHATAFAVHGPLDAAAMQRAIAALVERHAALRTTLAIADGGLTQTIHARGAELEVLDLSAHPDRGARARQLFAAISRPHDLGREAFRAQLLRLDAHEHVLLLAPHHIVLDGFSWDVLDADLAALYRAFATGAAPRLAPLTLAYRDFCFWQRSLEERPLGRAQLAFWERAVAGYEGLELPGDRGAVARGAIGMATDTYPSGAVPFVLDGAAWTAVERLCAQLRCTPYAVVATAFLLLLTRWSGRHDACTLTGNFHRNRPGSEAVIGNFVTPYPLRVAFDVGATLEATLRRCHEAILVHREHGHVAPTSALAAWPEWSRYNLNYLLDVYAEEALDFGAVRVAREAWDALEQRTPHDLGLFVRQGAGGVRGNLVYNRDRFSPELAARAAARLRQIIDALATAPSTRVDALPGAP